MSAPTRNETEAHYRRKDTDAREVLNRASQYDIVVEGFDDDGTPMTHIEQVTTFLTSRDDVHVGQPLRVRITDVGDSWAQALVIARLD